MARPPIIISNGNMVDKLKSRAGVSEGKIKEILYGTKGDNGLATLVTLKGGSQFVYWRTDDAGDKKFTCLDDKEKSNKGYPTHQVVGEVDI